MKSNVFLKYKLVTCLTLLGFFFVGCNTSSDNPESTSMSLQIKTVESSSQKASSKAKLVNDTLKIEGTNGTLIIDDVRFIVEDFELEKTNGECENLSNENDCEELEAGPFFVDLPLTADSISLGNSQIESGLYEELEFEVDDLDTAEEEDPEEQQQKQDLINTVRSAYPDWPTSASMVITGSFISSEGDTTQFKTFAEAEIEIEMEFNPPLEITGNSAAKLLKINIDPVDWFLRTDNTVLNLSQYDYDTTNELLEFEVDIENSFKSVEVDDDD